MSNSHDSHPIVVRRGKARAKPHGNHSWKIAYADFMTAMMAFFLVLWLLSASSPKTLVGVAEYFRTPLKVAIAGGDKSSLSSSVIPGGGMDPLRKDGEVQRATDNDPDAVQKRRDQQEGERLRALKNRLEQIIENNPVLRQFRPQLLLDITSEGLRIQILDTQNRPMFRTGSAMVEPYMRVILREIAPVLNELPNKVSLSGHTDAANYSNGERDYSNWELSADRANASRRELISGGMNEGKVLRVLGLAATMPLDRKDLMAPVNRRISIVVLNARAQARFEAENASAADVAVKARAGQAGEDMKEALGADASAPAAQGKSK
ncbi:flagellar motor protein MotB [Cupriavidus sp. USMAA2-4]|uniref:Flagellar motor protein MotB n=1 Tax=Cupriavidus malaysiensis TaxID=367825 RepID=A0ABM6F9W7_9BURK|nr:MULTISPECIES: flagellar motor protein MotB [Cupriavidus]AOY95309.1 flagellar motor protein MotB [Cupriavidus sp. USMAA2-4]AOZ01790.1 flagellar motor protein MotB [Cupriavidus sp. USMAHM13]AOZ08473.1 flagellar motor protein MotB [Cupriavidus malaysiensis]